MFCQFLDINECLTSPCSPNAQCIDTIGSFTCTCNTGYIGNGVTCAGMFLIFALIFAFTVLMFGMQNLMTLSYSEYYVLIMEIL